MIKKIAMALSASVLISACTDAGDTGSSNSGDSDKYAACVKGHYVYQIPGDGKWHFSSDFDGNGNVFNRLEGGDPQKYTATASTVTWSATFDGAVQTFTWNITAAAADCNVTQFVGLALNGTTPAQFNKK